MQIDKQAHFWWGMAMTAMLSFLFHLWFALAVTVFAGMVKEWHDEYIKGGIADPMDFLATVLGGFVATVWIYLMNSLP